MSDEQNVQRNQLSSSPAAHPQNSRDRDAARPRLPLNITRLERLGKRYCEERATRPSTKDFDNRRFTETQKQYGDVLDIASARTTAINLSNSSALDVCEYENLRSSIPQTYVGMDVEGNGLFVADNVAPGGVIAIYGGI